MAVLQRINADHRLTYGELSILNMVYITLEPTIHWRKGMVGRIPAGRYVLKVGSLDHGRRGAIELMDVPDRDFVCLDVGTSISQTHGNPLVGVARSGNGTITGGAEAFDEIHQILSDAIANDEECFLDVRDVV